MSGFWYVATPYSKYPRGQTEAFRMACRQAGLLIHAGIPCFSPIAHAHYIALACGLDPLDHTIWMAADAPLMDAARGLIVVKAEGWNQSIGVRTEIRAFEQAGKPVVYMSPGIVPDVLAWDRDAPQPGAGAEGAR